MAQLQRSRRKLQRRFPQKTEQTELISRLRKGFAFSARGVTRLRRPVQIFTLADLPPAQPAANPEFIPYRLHYANEAPEAQPVVQPLLEAAEVTPSVLQRAFQTATEALAQRGATQPALPGSPAGLAELLAHPGTPGFHGWSAPAVGPLWGHGLRPPAVQPLPEAAQQAALPESVPVPGLVGGLLSRLPSAPSGLGSLLSRLPAPPSLSLLGPFPTMAPPAVPSPLLALAQLIPGPLQRLLLELPGLLLQLPIPPLLPWLPLLLWWLLCRGPVGQTLEMARSLLLRLVQHGGGGAWALWSGPRGSGAASGGARCRRGGKGRGKGRGKGGRSSGGGGGGGGGGGYSQVEIGKSAYGEQPKARGSGPLTAADFPE
jgi:hypothetical protein